MYECVLGDEKRKRASETILPENLNLINDKDKIRKVFRSAAEEKCCDGKRKEREALPTAKKKKKM